MVPECWCIIIGLFSGVCAAIIDIGTTWMSDLKEGICLEAFWFNREQCCWRTNDTSFDEEEGCTAVRPTSPHPGFLLQPAVVDSASKYKSL